MKWRVLLLDTKKKNPNHYLMLGIFDALKSHPDVDLVVKAEYGNAISKAIEGKCNLFFAFDGEQLEPAFCERLKKVCGKSLAWFVEDPYEISINKENAKLFDLVFTNDKESVIEYAERGRHLPLAACEKLHYYEVGSKSYLYDLFFAGTAWPNRISLLKSIENEIKDIKFKLALPTNEYLPKINLKLNKSAYCWRTPNSEFAHFSNRSAVVLSLHRQFTASEGRAEAATPGPRLFEVAMAGGFQLVDINIPGVSDYFVEGEDYDAFSSPEECISKLKYYLNHPDERIRMAQSAQKKVQQHHTYKNRIDTILNEMSGVTTSDSINELEESKRNILIVAHNIVKNTPFGGVEIYLDHLNHSFKNCEYELFYYIPNNKSPEGKEYFLLNSDYDLIERISFPEKLPVITEYMLSCEQRERRFGEILNKYHIDLVHYQHLIRHIPSLPYISKALGIPSIFSMHDYFSISHRFNLIDNQGNYRKETFSSLRNADIFLRELENIDYGSHAKRVAFWSNLLKVFDYIHTNSNSTKEMLLAHYPNLDENKILTRGIPCCDEPYRNPITLADVSRENLEVLVLGNFTRVKGANTLLHVFNETRDSGIKFHVYGQIDNEFHEIIKKMKFDHVGFYGKYNNSDLSSILSGKHVSLHLSTWPETYCITLSEVWRAGIIPIVTDIGALGERVNNKNGFKVNVDDVGSVVEHLEFLHIDRDYLLKLRSNVLNAEYFENTAKHTVWLKSIYHNIFQGRPILAPAHTGNGIDLTTCGVKLSRVVWASTNNSVLLINNSGALGRIPRHPYYFAKFIIFQVRTRGFKVTMVKGVKKIARVVKRCVGV